MLKWVAKQMGVVPLAVQKQEAEELHEKLARSGEMELKAIAEMVLEYRYAFENKGIRVANPTAYVQDKPAIITRLEDFLTDLQKGDDKVRTAAIMIWLHTMRAALAAVKKNDTEYPTIVKRLWGIVGRGFSEVGGDSDYPVGFEPHK